MTEAQTSKYPGPPIAGDETATLIGSLERMRAIFAWKCGGLDRAGLSTRIGVSEMTLGGLLKHLALVEDDHFNRLLFARGPGEPWDSVDWDADPNWEWRTAAEDSPEQLMALWEGAVGRSRALVAEAIAEGGMDAKGKHVSKTGESPVLRRVLIDMIEEYARHTGHADLLREAADGLVGEDPPSWNEG